VRSSDGFATIPGPMPRTRRAQAGELNRALDVALAHGDLALALGAAKDLPAVDLPRAARILHLMARDGSPLFDRAAARWLVRYATEAPGFTADRMADVAIAVADLPDTNAAETLLAAVKGAR
jgi:hypothetical protein